MHVVSTAPEPEPPSIPASDIGSNAAMVDRVIAMAHLTAAPHVAIIGRHTLPFVLALMQRGCDCVRSLRPDAAAPDCETADLAWIVDVQDEHELNEALRAARRRTGDRGRVVVEAAACRYCRALCDNAASAGLDVVSFDHLAQRVVLAVLAPLALAA